MNYMLRRFVLAPVVLAAAAMTATSAMAATSINVPFSFTVEGKYCPPGRYLVDKDRLSHIVTLRSVDNHEIFNWVVGPGEPAPTDTKVSLKFDQTGVNHALRSVQFGPEITSRLDKQTKQSEHNWQHQGQ
jgi:hypothetical protein